MSAKWKNYRFSPRARQDLEDIWFYTFQQWSPLQADNYIAEILQACRSLVQGVKVGVKAEIRQGYWKCYSGSHVIFYKISGQFLDVIRILHQSRDVAVHLAE